MSPSHTCSNQCSHGQLSNNKNDRGLDKFKPDGDPLIDGDTRQIANLIVVKTALVGGNKNKLLVKSTDGR